VKICDVDGSGKVIPAPSDPDIEAILKSGDNGGWRLEEAEQIPVLGGTNLAAYAYSKTDGNNKIYKIFVALDDLLKQRVGKALDLDKSGDGQKRLNDLFSVGGISPLSKLADDVDLVKAINDLGDVKKFAFLDDLAATKGFGRSLDRLTVGHVEAWDVLINSKVIRSSLGNLETISKYLDDFPDRGPLLKKLFAYAAGDEPAYFYTLNKLSDNLDAVVLDATSLGLDDATKAAKAWLIPEPGWHDVIIHGDIDEFKVFTGEKWVSLNHRDLADYMYSQGYSGGQVRLISCKTGVFEDAIGQHLSNKLGVVVKAPKANITVRSDGLYSIDGNKGWRTFIPGTIP
jgi:hypothetical protein